MKFQELFAAPKPLIACIHLPPLPGSPRYGGNMTEVYETTLSEAEVFGRHAIDGLLVENFRDVPFYPDRVPPETVASLTAVTREIVKIARVPVGVNVLRNDARTAVAVATACQAHFIRVNVHLDAMVSDQGILQGKAHETLRLRAALRSDVLIFADVAVKHAAPLTDRGLAIQTRDLTERGLADALIVSGAYTGDRTSVADIEILRAHTDRPVLIGSGVTPDNLNEVYPKVDGMIVGSFFKKDGRADNPIEESHVKQFIDRLKTLA